jgi:hypothetical protein
MTPNGQWLATGDEEIRKRLLDRGLVIPRAAAADS